MISKKPMTIYGKKQLETELKRLIQEERPRILVAIEDARALGDLSENADYNEAKERQAFVEARISEIQEKIANSEAIDPATVNADKIMFGAHVTLKDYDDDKTVTYQIVGEDEADVKQGKISIFSPLASSLINKKKGDSVEFNSPKGEKEYEILDFCFK